MVFIQAQRGTLCCEFVGADRILFVLPMLCMWILYCFQTKWDSAVCSVWSPMHFFFSFSKNCNVKNSLCSFWKKLSWSVWHQWVFVGGEWSPLCLQSTGGFGAGLQAQAKGQLSPTLIFLTQQTLQWHQLFFLIENYSFLVKIQQYVWGIALIPSYPLKDQLKHILKQIHFSKVPTNTAMRKKALKKSKFVLLNFGSYCKTNQEMKAMWVVLKKKCTSLTLKDFL